MGKRSYASLATIVVGIGLALFMFALRHSATRMLGGESKAGSAEKAQSSYNAGPDDVSRTQKNGSAPSINDLRKAFEKIGPELEKFGWTKIPTAQNHLKTAVSSHDRREIIRAFTEIIYSGKWKTSEVIPVLKRYIENADPSVRYLAAKDLLTVGDEGGAKALIAMDKASDPTMDSGQDLRVQAAQMLARFQQTDAIGAIVDLMNRGPLPGLGKAYADLGIPFPSQVAVAFQADSSVISEYAKMNAAMYPDLWETYAVDRANWPIFSWARNYTVKINK